MNTKLVLIFTGLLLVLSACGKSKGKEDGITLKVWETYANREHIKFLEFVDKFEKDYEKRTGTKVHIKAERVPFNDFVTNIKMSALTGTTPDIGRVPYEKIVELAYHRVLVPLDELPNFGDKSIKDFGTTYLPASFRTNIVEIKGVTHLYGLPDQATFSALFYNKKLFKADAGRLRAAGLDPERTPVTWDELVEYAKVLTHPEKKQYGLALDNSLWWSMPIFYSYKTRFIKKDKNGFLVPAIPDEKSIAALQRKTDLCYKEYDLGNGVKSNIEAGAWRSGSSGPDLGFINENYAMIFMGPWNVKRFKDAGLDFGIGLIPKPSKEESIRLKFIPPDASDAVYNKEVTSATVLGGTNMAIFESCKYPDIALEFLKFITNPENQKDWCISLGQVPVNMEVYDEVRKVAPPEIAAFLEQAPYAQPNIMLPQSNLLETDIFNPRMELAFKGKMSVKDVLEQSAKDMADKILKPVNDSLK